MKCVDQSDGAVAAFFDKCAINGDMADFPPEELPKLRHFLHKWDIRPGQHVLEPGCGSGRLTVHLARAVGPGGRVLAIDLSPGMIRRARAHNLPPQAEFAVQTIGCLAEPDASFDHVICQNVFPHFIDRERVLAQLARVLKPRGHFWVNHYEGRESLNRFHRGVGGLVGGHELPDEPVMRGLLEGAGLTIVELADTPDMYLAHAMKGRE